MQPPLGERAQVLVLGMHVAEFRAGIGTTNWVPAVYVMNPAFRPALGIRDIS